MIVSAILEENDAQRVFYASVGEDNGQLMLKGSRAIGCVGIGDDFAEAKAAVDALLPLFDGPLFYRKDIGTPALIEKRMEIGERLLDILDAHIGDAFSQ